MVLVDQAISAAGTVSKHHVDLQPEQDSLCVVVLAALPLRPHCGAARHVKRVVGGAERANSVLNALQVIDAEQYPWVLVHDAARPLVQQQDILQLLQRCLAANQGGILAFRVRDTMKRGERYVSETVDREHLWHALTPQFFPTALLKAALRDAISQGVAVTDEASAMEWAGHNVLLVEGRSDNIKITQPADLALAAFYLEQSS